MSVCLSVRLSGQFPGTARTDRLSAGVSYIWVDTDTEKERERERRGQEQRLGDKVFATRLEFLRGQWSFEECD